MRSVPLIMSLSVGVLLGSFAGYGAARLILSPAPQLLRPTYLDPNAIPTFVDIRGTVASYNAAAKTVILDAVRPSGEGIVRVAVRLQGAKWSTPEAPSSLPVGSKLRVRVVRSPGALRAVQAVLVAV